MKRFLLSTLLLLFAIIGFGCDTNETPDKPQTNVRFYHGMPGIFRFDIGVDKDTSRVFTSVSFEDVTEYVSVDAGRHTFNYYQAGSKDLILLDKTSNLDENKQYTFFAFGRNDNLTNFIEEKNQENPASGKMKVQFVQGLSTLDAVEIYITEPDLDLEQASVSSGKLLRNVGFGETATTIDLTPGTYQIRLVPVGNPSGLIDLGNHDFAANAFTVVVINENSVGGTRTIHKFPY